MNLKDREAADAVGCEGCTLSSRRHFLATGLALAGALLSIGVPESLGAFEIGDVAGERSGETIRYPIPATDGAQIDRKNEVILVRWQGTAYAFALSCPHQNNALRWIDKDQRFQCPKHKSRYTPDGTFISGRATRGMDRYTVSHEGTEIVVDLGALHDQEKDAAGWAAASVKIA